eukprot:GDKJ01063716.1.p1 GENE.GDKJ01063716.1~~GDKJ01063716.1.p1  ORF type:complete len:500 (+),score=106.16 GDKJ01063716.1:38-1537(+)
MKVDLKPELAPEDASESEEITETEGFTSDQQGLGTNNHSKTTLRSRNITSKLPDPKLPVLEADQPREKKLQTFKLRFIFTIAMLSGFIFINFMGHFYCILLVLMLTIGMFREILRIKRRVDKDTRLPFFYFLRWYIFVLAFGIGFLRWLMSNFDWHKAALTHPEGSWQQIVCLAIYKLPNYLPLISYILMISTLIMFTLSLRQFSLRYQFHQLGWVVLTCLLIVAQTLGQIALIYNGLFWFFLSNSLVIVNDIFAYIFGVLFGKTRLIALSPKKTVEGFIGASFSTVIWGILFTYFFSEVPQLSCPETHFHAIPFKFLTELSSCAPRQYLIPQLYELPNFLANILGFSSFMMKPLYLHLIVLSTFAGLIAPFGGFFASGFKRAFKIKDFGDSIPGHGGFTDRFDCMLIMGSFTVVYFTTFIQKKSGIMVTSTSHQIVLDQSAHFTNAIPIDALNMRMKEFEDPVSGAGRVAKTLKGINEMNEDERRFIFEVLKGELVEI